MSEPEKERNPKKLSEPILQRNPADGSDPGGTGTMGIYIGIGKDKGRWDKGTRIRKVGTKPGDTHQDGALGTIVGAWGPSTASQRAESIIALDKNGVDGDIEYIYWVEWDDLPGIPVAITDNRIEPIVD